MDVGQSYEQASTKFSLRVQRNLPSSSEFPRSQALRRGSPGQPVRSFIFAPAQKHDENEQWDQRENEKQGAPLMVNWAMNHLRSKAHAKRANHPYPKSVAQDSQGNHQGNKENPTDWHSKYL
jgi:hypothetical protein